MAKYTSDGKPVREPSKEKDCTPNGVLRNIAIGAFFLFVIVGGIIGLYYVLSITLLGINVTQPDVKPYLQGYQQTIKDPLNPSQSAVLTVNLESTNFGAQFPITVYAKLQPTEEARTHYFLSHTELPESYRIWFDGTYCRLSNDKYERVYSCWFDLERVPQANATWYNVAYQNQHAMNYTYGGTFGVGLGVGATNEKDRIHSADFINIESVESTNSFRYALRANILSQISLLVSSISVMLTLVTLLYKGYQLPIFKSLSPKNKQ